MTDSRLGPMAAWRVRQTRRPLALLLCTALLAWVAAGCSSADKTGAAIGAATGAAVGAATGAAADSKNRGRGAAIGAGAGAIVGGAVGWAVGTYQVKQVRPREEVVGTTGYTPQQGVVARIDQVNAAPSQLKPGDQITFQAQYTVVGPPESGQIRVRESRTVFFNNQALTELPARELVLAQGTNQVQHSLTIPGDAAQGPYRVTTTIQPLAANARHAQASAGFTVNGGAAVARPAATPASTTGATAAPRPGLPDFVYVKAGQANAREGAGTSHRIVSTVSRGARLTVLDQAGPDSDRWYKVRLADGREAWIAASVLSLAP